MLPELPVAHSRKATGRALVSQTLCYETVESLPHRESSRVAREAAGGGACDAAEHRP